MENLHIDANESICEVQNEKEAEIEKYATQARNLAELNEELRSLFEEERLAMTQEKSKLELQITEL